MQILAADRDRKIAALRENSYFSSLSDQLLEDLAGGVSLRRYERGEVLFWEGEPCDGLYYMRSGSVKLFKTSPQGRELIIRVFEEGATFNEVPVFDRGLNPVNVEALETCDVWVIDSLAIRNAMDVYPEMCPAVIKNLTENLRSLVDMLEELSFYQVTNRLARLLSRLPEEQLSGSASQRLTQDQIAARLGTVREVVARALRELQRSGAIRVKRSRIDILDKEILGNWAECPQE